MQPTTMPYDGPNRYEILHLIRRFNAAHHDLDHINTVRLTQEDNTKVDSLATFERDRKLKNTKLDSTLDAIIKDLADIRKIGSEKESANLDWERIAGNLKKLDHLVEHNKTKYAAVRAQMKKDVEREQQRRDLEFYRQQKAENDARAAKEVKKEHQRMELYRQQKVESDARVARGVEKEQKTVEAYRKQKADNDERAAKEANAKRESDKKLAERQAQTAKLQGEMELAFENVWGAKGYLGKNKVAPKPPARLEVPGNAARPVSPGKQNRPINLNTQNQPNSPNPPKVQGHQNQPMAPKAHDQPQSPAKKLKKERPRITTEVKKVRLKKAHEEALRLASEVRKFD